MKVAEAMRLADEMALPDLRGQFIERWLDKWEGEKPPCCAIGGAAVASGSFRFASHDFGGAIGLTNDSVASAEFPDNCEDFSLLHRPARCPVDPCEFHFNNITQSVPGRIQHLYDHHEWSRRQIADWLDSLDAVEVA